jgi:hypothetical protein
MRWRLGVAAGVAVTLGFLACVGSDSASNPDAPTPEGGTSDGSAVGTESNVCFPNNTCNTGLTCLSNRCVRLPDASGGDDDADGGASDSGGDACATGVCGTNACSGFFIDKQRNLVLDVSKNTTWMIVPFQLQTWSQAISDCDGLGHDWSLSEDDSLRAAIADDVGKDCAFQHPDNNADWSITGNASSTGHHYDVDPGGNLVLEADTVPRNVRCKWNKH